MKKTIKLRDLIEEQYKQWVRCHCVNLNEDCADEVTCGHCPFNWIACQMLNENIHDLWTAHKDIYSDKFLDQTIEIEVPDLLTEEEKALLNKLIGLSAFKIHGINFIICDGYVLVELITANPCEQNDFFHFKKGMFKGIEETKRYAPSDLGLEDK